MQALIISGVVTFIVGITIWSIMRVTKNENGCNCGCECNFKCTRKESARLINDGMDLRR